MQVLPSATRDLHMKTVVPGQLAGYTLQYYRALLRLLECKPGESVAIEHIGDVSVSQKDGTLILEEDKSSVSGNPVGDLSINVWKTFHNWILFLQEAKIDVSQCRFVLYVVANVTKPSLLEAFSRAHTSAAINAAIRRARAIVEKSTSAEIRDFGKFVLEDNRKLFQGIVGRLDVQSVERESSLENEIRDALLSMMVPETRVDEIKDKCLGWLISKVVGEIQSKNSPIVEHNDFRRENAAFFAEFRAGVLSDYSKGQLPDNVVLAAEGQSDKVYVRQLQAIKVSKDKLLQACTDFYRAGINRQMWIERELISQEAAEEFENKLCSAYQNKRERINLLHPQADDIQKGQLLLNDCEGVQERIAGQDVADRTVPGTYQHLSNDLRVGWHPLWESMFRGKEPLR